MAKLGIVSMVIPRRSVAFVSSAMAAVRLVVIVAAAKASVTAMTASMLTEAGDTLSLTAEVGTPAAAASPLLTLLDAAEPSA